MPPIGDKAEEHEDADDDPDPCALLFRRLFVHKISSVPAPDSVARRNTRSAATTSSTAMPSDLNTVMSSAELAALDPPEHELADLAANVRCVEQSGRDVHHDVAGFDDGRGLRVDVEAAARDQRRRHLLLSRPAGADAHDMRALRHPRILDHRRRRCGDQHDQVGAAHRRLCRFCRDDRHRHPAAHVVHELLAAPRFRRPDPHLLQLTNELIGLEMTARLHAAADDGERRRLGSRQEASRDRRDRGGAGLGDVAAIHDRLQRPGLRIEQQDRRQVGRQIALVVFTKHRDQLRAEARRRRHIGRHQSEVRLRRSDREHRSDRLQHFARRELGQRRFHRRNQIRHRQQRVDVLFGQETKVLSHAVRIVLV